MCRQLRDKRLAATEVHVDVTKAPGLCMRSMGSAGTCSTICAVLRFPCRPMRPVKQNWQFCAQPTCEEMQSVVRGRLELGLDTGMITASTVPAAPSPCSTRSRGHASWRQSQVHGWVE